MLTPGPLNRLSQSPIFSNRAMCALGPKPTLSCRPRRRLRIECSRRTDPQPSPHRFRNLFPGFGLGLAAFVAYVAYDETINAAKKDSHH